MKIKIISKHNGELIESIKGIKRIKSKMDNNRITWLIIKKPLRRERYIKWYQESEDIIISK